METHTYTHSWGTRRSGDDDNSLQQVVVVGECVYVCAWLEARSSERYHHYHHSRPHSPRDWLTGSGECWVPSCCWPPFCLSPSVRTARDFRPSFLPSSLPPLVSLYFLSSPCTPLLVFRPLLIYAPLLHSFTPSVVSSATPLPSFLSFTHHCPSSNQCIRLLPLPPLSGVFPCPYPFLPLSRYTFPCFHSLSLLPSSLPPPHSLTHSPFLPLHTPHSFPIPFRARSWPRPIHLPSCPPCLTPSPHIFTRIQARISSSEEILPARSEICGLEVKCGGCGRRCVPHFSCAFPLFNPFTSRRYSECLLSIILPSVSN